LVLAFNLNVNSVNVNALDLDSLTSADDFGQSVECVIVVVGCDGTGSVGSSGDTIIGSNNGNNNNQNNPSPTPELPTCEECFTNYLSPEEIDMLVEAGFVGVELSCIILSDTPPEDLVSNLNTLEIALVERGIDAETAEAVVECLLELFQ